MVEGGLPDPRSRGRTPSGGLGGPVAKDAEGRLVVGALRRMWSVASKPPSKSQQEVADALARLMPPEAYATALVDLTKSHDKRPCARADRQAARPGRGAAPRHPGGRGLPLGADGQDGRSTPGWRRSAGAGRGPRPARPDPSWARVIRILHGSVSRGPGRWAWAGWHVPSSPPRPAPPVRPPARRGGRVAVAPRPLCLGRPPHFPLVSPLAPVDTLVYT